MIVRFPMVRKCGGVTSLMVAVLLLFGVFLPRDHTVSNPFKVKLGKSSEEVVLFSAENATRNSAHHLLKITGFNCGEFGITANVPFFDNRSTGIRTVSPFERNTFYTYITTHAP